MMRSEKLKIAERLRGGRSGHRVRVLVAVAPGTSTWGGNQLPALVAEDPVEVADSDPHAKLAKGFGVVVGRVVKVLGLANQGEHFPPPNTKPFEHPAERFQVRGVDVEEFVLVELDFDGKFVGEDRNSCASVVFQQLLELTEVAFQDRSINVVAAEILMAVTAVSVATLQNHMHYLTQRFEEGQKDIEEILGRDGCGQHGKTELRPAVAINLDPVPLAGWDQDIRAGSDSVCQDEVAVAVDTEVRGQPFRVH
jgi:uncharacterized coiled-coil protein SlyX